jgi:two-component system response regulator YesN
MKLNSVISLKNLPLFPIPIYDPKSAIILVFSEESRYFRVIQNNAFYRKELIEVVNVILVDDEPIITEGLMVLIDWEAHGAEVVCTFSSSTKALQYMVEHEPDIALVDINMPNINGLDLIKKAKQSGLSTKFIILTGYSDFKYAQEAVNNGAERYLLKPTVKDQLDLALKETIRKMGKEAKWVEMERQYEKLCAEMLPIMQEKFLLDLLKGDIDINEMIRRAGELEINLFPTNYASGVINIDNLKTSKQFHGEYGEEILKFAVKNIAEETLKNYRAGWAFQLNEQIVIFIHGETIMHESDILYLLHEVKNNVEIYIDETLTIGVGRCYTVLLDYKTSYDEAITALESSFMAGKNKLIHIQYITQINDHKVSTNLAKYKRNLIGAIKKMDWNLVQANLEEISDAFVSLSEHNQLVIKNLYIELYIILLWELKDFFSEEIHRGKYDCINEIAEIETHDELICYMEQLIGSIVKGISGKYKNKEIQVIDTIKQFILDNYDKQIGLKTIASQVYMNPSYLSHFFKMNTGNNISDYILELKMKKALEFFMTSDLKVYELAEKVGYNDPRRFSDAFKNFYGLSPHEYRIKLKYIDQ